MVGVLLIWMWVLAPAKSWVSGSVSLQTLFSPLIGSSNITRTWAEIHWKSYNQIESEAEPESDLEVQLELQVQTEAVVKTEPYIEPRIQPDLICKP